MTHRQQVRDQVRVGWIGAGLLALAANIALRLPALASSGLQQQGLPPITAPPQWTQTTNGAGWIPVVVLIVILVIGYILRASVSPKS